MTVDDTQYLDWSLKFFGPPFTMACIFIVGLVRRWWVLGWTYDACEKRLEKAEALGNDLQRIALSATGISETLVNIAKRST